MPRCGATLDENVPPLHKGDFGGGDQPTSPNPSLCPFGKEGSHFQGRSGQVPQTSVCNRYSIFESRLPDLIGCKSSN